MLRKPFSKVTSNKCRLLLTAKSWKYRREISKTLTMHRTSVSNWSHKLFKTAPINGTLNTVELPRKDKIQYSSKANNHGETENGINCHWSTWIGQEHYLRIFQWSQ